MMAEGVRQAADEWNAAPGAAKRVKVSVFEAGFNQAEWEMKLTSLAAGGRCGLIVSSNPSLPDIVRNVHAKFPAQKFLLLDGEISGVENIYSLAYRTGEEAWLAGYFAALVSQSLDPAARRVGLLAAQEYPVMNNVILPGFREGARAADADFAVDFRVLGNWFDAEKARALASDMYRTGSKALLCIAGSANEGVAAAAKNEGGTVVWFDNDGAASHPGTVAGSAVVMQRQAAYDKTRLYLSGALPFGASESAGVKEGYIGFVPAPDADPAIVEKMEAALEDLR
jgi:simple sugar transport system substrate-binding protein